MLLFSKYQHGMFDYSLSMEKQVKKICQSAFYHIRNVNSARKTLSDNSAATIIHALVTSRLDNGNALLYKDTLMIIF